MKGYPKLALLMGDCPETAIFRRFSALSAQNLLYLQAELRNLEVDLRRYAAEDDVSSHPDRKVYSVDWFALQDSAAEAPEEGNDNRQWDTILKIRGKLAEYQIALLRHKEIIKDRGPMRRDLNFLNRWMERTDMGAVYLHGEDRNTWKNPQFKDDLLALKVHADDFFFQWVYEHLVFWYHYILGRYIEKPSQEAHLAGTVIYSETAISRWTKLITTTLACTLPVASIVLLNAVENTNKRLGITAALTAAFSFCLAITTSAKMSEIFAATSAYAAVQVVFIGSTVQSSFLESQQ